MDSRYNIYFNGQLLEGQNMASVRDRLARLFNADEPTLDKLFSGKPQLIKRDCDHATALKFKQAIERAGGVPLIRNLSGPEQASPGTATTDTATSTDSAADTMTRAQRIAMVAGAPDIVTDATAAPVATNPGVQATAATPEGLALAPRGTDVLRPEERPQPVARVVDTSRLDLDLSGQRLSAVSPPAPVAPDTSHLSVGEAGAPIPTLRPTVTAVTPDIGSLDLAPDGTDFSDCALAEVELPDLDLTGIELAPAGTDVLDEKYRKSHKPDAPATDHLSLED